MHNVHHSNTFCLDGQPGAPRNLKIGHSIGGMIALRLATEKPHERLIGMNMTGSGALYNEQTKVAFASLISDAPTVMMDTTRYEEVNYGLTASAVSSLSLDPQMLFVCISFSFQPMIAKGRSGGMCCNGKIITK